MLDTILPVLTDFREKIYRFFSSRRDADMELIHYRATRRRVVLWSYRLGPVHRRNYCSIEYKPNCVESDLAQAQTLLKIMSELCVTEQKRAFHLFVVDCTPGPRIFPPTLEDRSYVYSPNTICRNKPCLL